MATVAKKATRKPRTKVAPENETKADRFKRLGTQRVNKAVKAILNIGNLSSRGNYEYTDEQITKIIDALNNAVGAVEAKFSAPSAKSVEAVTL